MTATGYPAPIANLSNTVKSLGGAIEKLAEYAKSHETRIKRLEKQVKKLEKADRPRKDQKVRSRRGR
jgi:peptidoglycan hydrolase CwlO-like protein